MLVLSANLNGLRSANKKGFNDLIDYYNPDIICVQETKAQLNTQNLSAFFPQGYNTYFSDALKKGYSGVGIMSKKIPNKIELYGHPMFDNEGRYMAAHFDGLIIISLYLPSGTSGATRQQFKMQCLKSIIKDKLRQLIDKKVIINGDFNIAHNKIDLKNWQSNQNKSGFLPEERQWFTEMLDLGWQDSYRMLNPDTEKYTWWTYRSNARSRNVGWRIDYQIISPCINLKSAIVIDEPIISDHAPLLLEIA